MLRYRVTNLYDTTSTENQQKLLAALEGIEGLKDVSVDMSRKEVSFGITGVEPKWNRLKEACTVAGFTLGIRM